MQQQQRASDDDVSAARKMFYAGFAFLPFVWFLNWIQFRKLANTPSAPDNFKFYIRGSLIGWIISFAMWGIWLAVFYSNLYGWGESLLVFKSGEDVP